MYTVYIHVICTFYYRLLHTVPVYRAKDSLWWTEESTFWLEGEAHLHHERRYQQVSAYVQLLRSRAFPEGV